MDLKRRLTLYVFGIILGVGVSYWFYGERLTGGAWLPENKIRQRLQSTLLKASDPAREQMAAWPTDLGTLRTAMPQAQVDLKASERTPDSIHYRLRVPLEGRDALLVVSVLRNPDHDSTATLRSLVLDPGR